MRIAALVLGCIGGGLLLAIGLLITLAHPYGLLFVFAGAMGITGGITARTTMALSAMFLLIATVLALIPFFVNLAGVRPVSYFLLCALFFVLAFIFTVAGPMPDEG